MAIDIIATTDVPKGHSLVLPSGRELFDSLAGEEEAKQTTFYISELLGKLFDQVRQVVDFECNVEVTISGSLTLAGKGEVKYLIVNVGGEATAQTTMTVKLSTKLVPQ